MSLFLRVAGEVVLDLLINLFVNARHRTHDRRPDVGEILLDEGGVAHERHGRAVSERVVVRHRALEGVREGQVAEEDVGFAEVEAAVQRLNVRDDVPVGEHHALGTSGRARRVDEAGDVVRTGTFGEAGVGDVVAGGEPVLDAEKVDRMAVDGLNGFPADHFVRQHDEIEVGQAFFGRSRGNGVPSGAGGRYQKARVGVAQDVGGGSRRVDGVQRNRHQTVAQSRLVEGDGVDAVGEQHGDAVALLQIHGGKGAAPAHDLVAVILPRDGNPAVFGMIKLPERFAVGPDGHGAAEHFGNGTEVVHKSAFSRCHENSLEGSRRRYFRRNTIDGVNLLS